eukprot:3038926-Amphidinium_carterae.1
MQKPDAAPMVARAKPANDADVGEQAPKRLQTEWATNGGNATERAPPPAPMLRPEVGAISDETKNLQVPAAAASPTAATAATACSASY